MPASAARAQTPASTPPADDGKPPPSDGGDNGSAHVPATGQKGSRIFGMLPNNATVEGATEIDPISVKEKFKLGAENAFDPYVLPFVAFTTSISQLEHQEPSFGFGASGYAKRYGLTFADNAIGDLMTNSVAPSVLHQDPRYFQLGRGGAAHRFGYAASRILITRSDSGRREFNWSEIGGNVAAAGISDTYYPSEARGAGDTAMRCAMSVLWDTLSNEMKEFWPDIRQKMHRKKAPGFTLPEASQ